MQWHAVGNAEEKKTETEAVSETMAVAEVEAEAMAVVDAVKKYEPILLITCVNSFGREQLAKILRLEFHTVRKIIAFYSSALKLVIILKNDCKEM